MAILTALTDVRRVLETSRVIAVLGASPTAGRAAHYVPAYLISQGYRIIPVNPVHAGKTLFGERVRASLGEVGEAVDIVDVFRRSDAIPGHLEEILAMEPRPRLVWLQLGIRHDATAAALSAEGIDVIQDRCTLADHRQMGITPNH